jgi:hypothetical protein
VSIPQNEQVLRLWTECTFGPWAGVLTVVAVRVNIGLITPSMEDTKRSTMSDYSVPITVGPMGSLSAERIL